MPRFGGRIDPGQSVHISVDGEETTIAPTPSGSWTHTVPELDDGEHEFEMWTEDGHGGKSDSIEWTNDVQAGAEDRASQRQRNQQWRQRGAQQFLEENDKFAQQPLTPPRTATGGGGAPSAETTGVMPGGGGVTESGPGGSSTPTSPAGLEKGNAGQTVGRVG